MNKRLDREFVLSHPDCYKIYEWNGPGYEGFLGGLFILHVSQDVKDHDREALEELMNEMQIELSKRESPLTSMTKPIVTQKETP